jgi:Ca2+-binding RTX toxin-like protein
MSGFLGTRRDDTITPDEVSPGVVRPGTPAPGDLPDVILGRAGDDSIASGGGDDVVLGGLGEDTIDAGAGDDRIIWNSHDGSDSIAGGEGFDTLILTGNARAESWSIFDGFDDGSAFRDVGLVWHDMSGIERIELHLLGGGDDVQISDLTATALEHLLIAFAPGRGRDHVSFIGTGEAESLDIARTAEGGIRVDGLGVVTEITGFEAARDRFIVSLGEGNDTVDARAFSGADLVVAAGAGDDLGQLGFGDDTWVAVGAPGNDTVEGSAGRDTLDLDASIADDVILLAGGPLEATASHAGDTILLRDFEMIEVESASGHDLVDGSAMRGGLLLRAFGGAGDDTMLGGGHGDMLDGGSGDDVLTGGRGRDRFAFGGSNADGRTDRDEVTDFGAADILDLRALGGGYDAEATAEGLLLTFAAADMDQVLLRGVGSLAEVTILG